MHKLFLFALVLFSLSAQAGNPNRMKHQEMNGLVSIEAEHFYAATGWETDMYYTGMAVFNRNASPDDEEFLEYRIHFTQTGTYQMYVLGNRDRKYQVPITRLHMQFQEADGGFPQTNTGDINSGFAPEWHWSKENSIRWEIPKSGWYLIRMGALDGSKAVLDKMVFSLDADFIPSGTGPAETLFGQAPKDPAEIILPPAWAFGVLYGGYTDQEQTREAVDRLVREDYPIDAYWIDSYFWDFNKGRGPKGYIDFTGDTLAFPDMEEMWDHMANYKIKSGIWVWNLINQEGNESVFREFNRENHLSSIYTNRNGWHNVDLYTITGVIDFEKKQTADYWKALMKPFFDKGLDFLKLDNSADPAFCDAAFSAAREFGQETKGRAFILAHLSNTYDPRFKLYPARWTGDAKIAWSQPDYPDLDSYAMGGLKENVEMVADPFKSTYEIPFLTNDAGGYDYFGSSDQSDELYIRWIQFASMNSLMTAFSTAKNPTRNHPYGYSPLAASVFKKYTHLRMRLFPYLYTEAFQTRLTGEKMVQGDGVHKGQYLLGDALLVAPVTEKGASSKEVWFPKGTWIDFEDGTRFEGNKMLRVKAPLEKLPLFIREGSIIPMRKYARAIELGTNDTLELHLYPGDTPCSYRLIEDDGISEGYRTGEFSTTGLNLSREKNGIQLEIEACVGNFVGMNLSRFYEIRVFTDHRPKQVLLDGEKVYKSKSEKKEGWNYDPKTNLLEVRITIDKVKTHVLTIR